MTKIYRTDLFRKAWQALLLTLSLAASFHLGIVTVTAIIQRDIAFLNPLDFLGVSIVFPQYRESTAAAAGGWVILITLFFTILYLSLHYHLYLSVIKESTVGRKLSAAAQKIQANTKRDKAVYLATKKRTQQQYWKTDKVTKS